MAPLVSLADALAHLPTVQLDEAGAVAARHGKPLPSPGTAGTFRLLGPDGDLVAVAEERAGRVLYLRVFKR